MTDHGELHMLERLQELLDHFDIRNLLATYCHGCDRGDEVQMASTYCEDSWDDHGARKMPGRQFAFESIEESLATTHGVSHQLGQSLIRVAGDDAGAETYFIATVRYPGADGVESINHIAGRYVDTFCRENGQWRIRQRICVRDWSITHPLAHDWLAGAGFVDGRFGHADPSCEVLGMPHSGNPWLAAGRPA